MSALHHDREKINEIEDSLAEARESLKVLAEEQATGRRLATLGVVGLLGMGVLLTIGIWLPAAITLGAVSVLGAIVGAARAMPAWGHRELRAKVARQERHLTRLWAEMLGPEWEQ